MCPRVCFALLRHWGLCEVSTDQSKSVYSKVTCPDFSRQNLDDESERFEGVNHLEWRKMRLSKSSECAVPHLDGVTDPHEA